MRFILSEHNQELIVDTDLTMLYEVETIGLNQAVRRKLR
jgi:hypothetical protein